MSAEGHFCWENCDEGPHGCICGNDCSPPTSHRGEVGDGPTTTNDPAPLGSHTRSTEPATSQESAEAMVVEARNAANHQTRPRVGDAVRILGTGGGIAVIAWKPRAGGRA